MRYFVLTAVLAGSVAAPVVVTAQPVAKQVLSIHDDLDEMCRGWSGDDPHTNEACAVRGKVEKLLGSIGYCFGPLDSPEGRAGMRWRKCR